MAVTSFTGGGASISLSCLRGFGLVDDTGAVVWLEVCSLLVRREDIEQIGALDTITGLSSKSIVSRAVVRVGMVIGLQSSP
jgi:hypothetical protein